MNKKNHIRNHSTQETSHITMNEIEIEHGLSYECVCDLTRATTSHQAQ
jgi:hypothetical protein